MSNTEAIVYYKRLCKALLSRPDRMAVQQCLQTFVQTKSFATLANDLPRILNTPRKRSIVPAIRGLIPEEYHSQFDRSLQHLGMSAWTTIEKEDATKVRSERVKKESEMEEEACRLAGVHISRGEDAFESFLEQQRQLSRGVPDADIRNGGQWGLMENADTVSSLEFTDEDDILYADVEELMDEAAPAIPPRYHNVVIKPPPKNDLPPIPPRKSNSISTPVSPNMTPATTPRTTRPASPGYKIWLPEWYNAGPLTRQDAEVELRKYGFTDGLFLIRDKGAGGIKYCLSVVWNQSVRHVIFDRQSYREPFLIDGKNYGNCYSPEEMVEKLRELGSRFEYTLVKPLRATSN
eukprot:m.33803 g.33803  ORF g.33803 m.33803 type:complete len:349 (+) comp6475_c0_seq1:266-1312(+)